MVDIQYRSFSLTLAMLLLFPILMEAYPQSPSHKSTHDKKDLQALVVGSNAYPEAPLRNPINDAKSIDNAITNFGFNVSLVLDTNLKKMNEAIDRFITNLEPGGVGLFYFAGHGIQLEGENYLVPVDFTLKDSADAKYSTYMVSRLVDRMEGARTRLNIIILDACRNNPFLPTRSTRGLAIMATPGRGTFIAFATGPGKTASDNPDGPNGLFTNYLLEVLKKPGLTLDEIFADVKEKVDKASNGKQTPWTVSNVIGKFYFNVQTIKPFPPPQNISSGKDASVAPSPPIESPNTPSEADHTELEIIGYDGKSTFLSDPAIAYPDTFGPSRITEGIVVRRGIEQSTLLWSRLRILRFQSRQEKNDKGTTVWRHDLQATLVNGRVTEVQIVDDWNMAYMGGGGTGLLFGQSDLGAISVPFSKISVLKVLRYARLEKK